MQQKGAPTSPAQMPGFLNSCTTMKAASMKAARAASSSPPAPAPGVRSAGETFAKRRRRAARGCGSGATTKLASLAV
jgi:hypothetical protein